MCGYRWWQIKLFCQTCRYFLIMCSPIVTTTSLYMTNIPRYVTKHLTLYDKRLTLCDKRRTVSWGQSKCMSTLHYMSTDTRDSWSLETSGHNILARCHGPLPSESVRKRRPWKRLNLRLLFSCFKSIFCFECQIIDLLVQRAKQLQGLGMISDQTTLLLHPWYHQYIWTPDNIDKRKHWYRKLTTLKHFYTLYKLCCKGWCLHMRMCKGHSKRQSQRRKFLTPKILNNQGLHLSESVLIIFFQEGPTTPPLPTHSVVARHVP